MAESNVAHLYLGGKGSAQIQLCPIRNFIMNRYFDLILYARDWINCAYFDFHGTYETCENPCIATFIAMVFAGQANVQNMIMEIARGCVFTIESYSYRKNCHALRNLLSHRVNQIQGNLRSFLIYSCVIYQKVIQIESSRIIISLKFVMVVDASKV